MRKRLALAKSLLASLLPGVLVLAGCTPAPATNAPFTRSGELIALSGGDAGPQAACHTCHGLRGEGDGNLVPRLAGHDRGYLSRQLDFFADGQRRGEQMSPIARHLSTRERVMVSAYYEAMPEPAAPTEVALAVNDAAAELYQQGDPARDIEACADCHGEAGEGEGPGNPALAGQPAPYLARQLRNWRKGERYGDPLGAMHSAARALNDREITAVAAYAAFPVRPLADSRARAAESR